MERTMFYALMESEFSLRESTKLMEVKERGAFGKATYHYIQKPLRKASEAIKKAANPHIEDFKIGMQHPNMPNAGSAAQNLGRYFGSGKATQHGKTALKVLGGSIVAKGAHSVYKGRQAAKAAEIAKAAEAAEAAKPMNRLKALGSKAVAALKKHPGKAALATLTTGTGLHLLRKKNRKQ